MIDKNFDVFTNSKRESQEAQTLIHALDLPAKWQTASRTFVLLETGFGNGLRFLHVLRQWHHTRLQQDNQPGSGSATSFKPTLCFYGLLSSPFKQPELELALQSHPELKEYAQALLALWPAACPGLHVLQFKQFSCCLYLWFGDLQKGVQQIRSSVDVVLVTHAITNTEEATVQDKLLKSLVKCAHTNTQWLGAKKPVSFSRSIKTASRLEHSKPIGRVAVVGAGVAGSCVAHALCERGVQVDLFDAASGPAQGASGNWMGAFHPHLSRDDNMLSQLTRLGFEFTLQSLQHLSKQGFLQEGHDWATPGHFQTVPPEQAERLRHTLEKLQMPENWASWVPAHTFLDTALEGVFFSQGGWIKPARWVEANLQACKGALTVHYNTPWNARSPREAFDAVVVACAQNSLDLAPVQGATANQVKGQITRVAKRRNLPCGVSGESYAIGSPHDDFLVLGATYERPVLHLDPTVQADNLNRSRFKSAFPGFALGENLQSRCAVRSVWADRLPAIGASDQAGVYLATGYASRGLLWASLGATVICSSLGLEGPSFALLERLQPTRKS